MHDALSVRAGQHAARADYRRRQRGGERVAVDGGHRGHAQGAHARLRRGAHQRQLRHHGRPLHGAIQESNRHCWVIERFSAMYKIHLTLIQ